MATTSVYPREIEEVLYQHLAIAEGAVIGVLREELSEDVRAVVTLKVDRCATEESIAFARERVAATSIHAR